MFENNNMTHKKQMIIYKCHYLSQLIENYKE